LAAGGDGIKVVDISDPISPQIVGSADTPGDAYGVDVAGSYLYVADLGGMLIMTAFQPLENLARVNEQVLRTEVPAGQKPGTWNLLVTNPDGSRAVLHNAFTLIDTEIEINIAPGFDPNSINCKNEHEIITVAILTIDNFDATTVDHTTVAFQGASETHVSKKSGKSCRHEEDVDGDGDIDLVFHFRLGDTVLTCDSRLGTLTGETFDGRDFGGIDAVRMID
jgi:hypothetical protein